MLIATLFMLFASPTFMHGETTQTENVDIIVKPYGGGGPNVGF